MKKPTILDQECFDDRASDKWIDGSELLKNKYWFNDERYKRWLYFYRPHRIRVGIPQAIKIKDIEASIRKIREHLTENLVILTLILIFSLFSIAREKPLILLMFVALFVFFYAKRLSLTREINLLISDKNDSLNEITMLHKECDMINKNLISGRQIWVDFWKDIKNLEENLIKEYRNYDRTIENIPDFYLNLLDDIKELPRFPAVPTWALLQPSQRISIGGDEVLGIRKIGDEIGTKVASWRNIGKDIPFFRVWHLHFIFFYDKNMDIISQYYDFISKKTYNTHRETYQYNHITNYFLSELDISELNETKTIKKIKLPLELT